MQNRIKEIRKYYKETQKTFGEKLNVSKSTIEAMEYGKRDATDRIVADICRVFNVNEEWLRTGEGEMFRPKTRNDEIADIFEKIYEAPPDDFQVALVKEICKMNDEQIAALKEFVLNLAEEIKPKNEN